MPKVPTFRPVVMRGPTVDPAVRERANDKLFYKRAAWRNLRSLKLAIDPLCQRCKSEGRTTLAVHVHHVKPRKLHPDLAFDMDNLRSLCLPCHTKEEREIGRG